MINNYIVIFLILTSCSSSFFEKEISKEFFEKNIIKTTLPPSKNTYFISIASSSMDPVVLSVFYADKIEDINFFIKKLGAERELNSNECILSKNNLSPDWWSPCQGNLFLSSEWNKDLVGNKIVVEETNYSYIVYFERYKI